MSIQVLKEQTIQKHTPAVRGTCGWLLQGPYRDYVDDAVQETWLKAHKYLEGGNAQTGNFQSWICTIARHTSLDFIQKVKSEKGNSSLTELQIEPKDARWTNLHEQTGMISIYSVVQDFIDNYLPLVCPLENLERYQRVFYLASEGFRQNEIAGRLEVSPPTIYRAMRFLRAEWKKYLSDNNDPGSGPGRGTTLGTTRGDFDGRAADRANRNRSKTMNAKAMIPASQLNRFRDLVLQLPAFCECENVTCDANEKISNLDEIIDLLARERGELIEETEVPGVTGVMAEYFLFKKEALGRIVDNKFIKPSKVRKISLEISNNSNSVGTIAYIVDAGKTTPTERILVYTGIDHKIGKGDEGKAEMDWTEPEQERGVTITSIATTCTWNNHQVNIIDTPGNFTAEVVRSLRALDGAVCVFDAVAGTEPEADAFRRWTNEHHMPQIVFINKMDRVGANPIVVQLPWDFEADLEDVIDLVRMKGLLYEDGDSRRCVLTDVPEILLKAATAATVVRDAWNLVRAVISGKVGEDKVMARELERNKPHVNIGTIGHVDYGKTALTVTITKALASMDVARFTALGSLDKAPEEREHVIKAATAHLGYPDHVDYVKNTITGAVPMNDVILCTRQMSVMAIMVLMNKCDLMDDEEFSVVETKLREQLSTCDFTGADFTGADIPGAVIPGAEIPGAEIPGDVYSYTPDPDVLMLIEDTFAIHGQSVSKARINTATAHLGYPDHVDYVKNMITGAVPMNDVILVVSVADGPTSWIREHFLRTRQMSVMAIVVLMNKCDLMGDEKLSVVETKLREQLSTFDFTGGNGEGIPVVVVKGTEVHVVVKDSVIRGNGTNFLAGGDGFTEPGKLMEACYSYTPDPDVLMLIEDTFAIHGQSVSKVRIERDSIVAVSGAAYNDPAPCLTQRDATEEAWDRLAEGCRPAFDPYLIN